LENIGKNCVLEGLDGVKEVLLQDNPLRCTCQIAWISKMIDKSVHVEGKCAEPDVFAGSSVSHLDFSLCDKVECFDGIAR